ncbi:hypothetical protein [Marinomonas algicola]|uniref:hypothetical protein n=1 Tax=Marinomonas algicola TaxID=2773454 RepID=UPI001748FB81|nr:hypothetical protein [Marinomonas algicola]
MNTLPVNYVELEAIYQTLEKRAYRCISLSGVHDLCGTSMTAYALAKRYQANGYRVLLVDVNLHHPNLDSQLGLKRLDWEVGCDQVAPIFAPSEMGTHYLTAPISNTASLSFRDPNAIQHSLSQWLEQYDRVIFDTAPISTTNYRDIPTNLICSAADASVLLMKSEFTTEVALKDCCERLAKANANLVGVVMNDVHFPSLASEMIRETERIPNVLNTVKHFLQRQIHKSTLLNFRI